MIMWNFNNKSVDTVLILAQTKLNLSSERTVLFHFFSYFDIIENILSCTRTGLYQRDPNQSSSFK